MTSSGCTIAPDGYDPQAVPNAWRVGLRNADGNIYFGKRVTVTGHFDDPAASTCRSTAALETEPPAPEFVVLGCRTAFVVTDIQPR